MKAQVSYMKNDPNVHDPFPYYSAFYSPVCTYSLLGVPYDQLIENKTSGLFYRYRLYDIWTPPQCGQLHYYSFFLGYP